MKKIVLVMSMLLLFVCGVFAQTEVSNEGTQIILDLSTFTGIVTVISSVVTQIFKLIPAIDGSKIAKIGISVGVGIIVCMLAWVLKISEPLAGLIWWQTLIYGVAAGLSGCGFYDLVKVVWELFKPKDEVIHLD
ncbi:hypothetical protein MUN53_18205 [Parabacteroides sp. AGMB00274]|uniref:Uncharacterized protein n=1 Tax=Parabacteroides faecalis TaxID=2924040 RepID=A0ABT0C676_9BACT|nr:hypothetical protein [Parabacteroides faecalis]MCJ2382509.1 hypothetical protein [Parabacteroides faecalis]